MRVAVVIVLLAACAPAGHPPVDDAGPGDGPPRIGPIDITQFALDRRAVAQDWFQYDTDSHLVTPMDRLWVVRDGDANPTRYAALRFTGYYDPDTTESGRFALETATYDGAWNVDGPWLLDGNVRIDGPACVDLFARSQVDCAGVAWQVQLRQFQKISTASIKTTALPGVYVRSEYGGDGQGEVAIAPVDGVDLAALPDPSTLTYAFDRTADGAVIGDVAEDDDVWLAIDGRFTLARFRMHVVDDALSFDVVRGEIDLEDDSTEEAPPAEHVDVALPADGEVALVSFIQADLVAVVDEACSWPHQPPNERDWDLAVERNGDEIRILASSATAIAAAGTTDVAAARPPTIP